MPVKEQQDVPSVIEPRPFHALQHDGLEIHRPTMQQLEPAAESNLGVRRNRQSLPPNFLLPNIRGIDTSAPSLYQTHDNEHTLDEATIGNRTTALRRLNGIAPRPRRVESTGTRTSSGSQPIIVRAYSGRTNSRPSSDHKVLATMYDKGGKSTDDGLPAVEVFSFQNILQTIEQEARGDVDAIAEICGKSKMSLANEYDAHMPPQGELLATRQGGHISNPRSSLNQTLMPVEEASSISERLHDDAEAICRDSSEIHHERPNANGDRLTEQDHITIVEVGPGQRVLDLRSHTPNSTSASFGLLATPTRAQQDNLRQLSLPIMSVSKTSSPAQGNATRLTLESSTVSPDKASPDLTKSTALTAAVISNQLQALPEEPSAVANPTRSRQRQSSLFTNPWLSWTSKRPLSEENSGQSSEANAVSSLRNILDRSSSQNKIEGHTVIPLHE
ncbi:MAG: hypothetical protein M1830_005260 [Pleopsidium flavum]|nr:MAG: hypothetical protein M1830_006213 [Pleopsidium flavum]KAI9876930.1 MAG: hypothetical protein M1830_005260 [Pleopsidium flavum]